jgi:predicted GNAT family acetyltransferase
MTSMSELRIDVTDNPSESRYEIHVDGRPAGLIRYVLEGDTIALVHTEVDAAIEGHGLGGKLVAGALDDARARGLRVRPLCPFVASYLRRHPEYGDLVAAR